MNHLVTKSILKPITKTTTSHFSSILFPKRAPTIPTLTTTTRQRFTTTTVNTTEVRVVNDATLSKEQLDPATYSTRPHPTDPTQPALGPLRSYKVFLEKDQKVLWCSCGHSKSLPFCDGTHKTLNIIDPITNERVHFKPIIFQAPETKIFSLCMCKYSKHPIICDGQHKLFEGWAKPPKPFPPNPPPSAFDPSLI